jgi:hypothetical protein
MSRKLPTDREILNVIFDMYFDDYVRFDTDPTCRTTKNALPIDVKKVAAKLNAEANLVFTRLYYHLNNKFSYKNDRGVSVTLFLLRLGETETNSINFAYMTSVLADLRHEHRMAWFNLWMAAVSAIGALLSVGLAFR